MNDKALESEAENNHNRRKFTIFKKRTIIRNEDSEKEVNKR